MTPLLFGDDYRQKSQYAWFYLLYADKGVVNLVERYLDGGVYDVIDSFISARRIGWVPLTPIAEQLDLVNAIGPTGWRVVVPYYPPFDAPHDPVRLSLGGESIALKTGESLSRVAIYNQLANGKRELFAALARESVKNSVSHSVVAELEEKNPLLSQAINIGGRLYAAITADAETRNWLMLPERIAFARLYKEPGEYHLDVRSSVGHVVRSHETVNLSSDQIEVVRVRSF